MTRDQPRRRGRRCRVGGAVLDIDDGCVSLSDPRVSLPPRLVRILDLLGEAAPRTVTKASFLEQVWPDRVVTEAALTQRIKELRKLVGD